VEIKDVKKIGVLGAGIMGCGIAQTCALAGYKVTARDISQELIEKAKTNLINGRFGLKSALERGKITQEQYDLAIKNITFTTSMEELCKDADVIIEAVPEVLHLKIKMFREIDKLCPEHTVFASNTSGFPIGGMAGATDRPDKVVGMHWFNPAPVMKLVEIIKTDMTSEETVNCIKDLALKCGKTPIIVKDADQRYGFVASRAYNALLRECLLIVQEGIATPEQVDTALKLGYNLPMGPFELMGLVGKLGRTESKTA
jgi:3-hydroxybutyryl-CoA dehydrogenase